MNYESLFIAKAKHVFPIMCRDRTPDDCWMWGGRATWSVKQGGKLLSTTLRRIAYAAFRGEIPEFHEVKTTCKHPDCVNPNHLTTRLSVRLITRGFSGRTESLADSVEDNEPTSGTIT